MNHNEMYLGMVIAVCVLFGLGLVGSCMKTIDKTTTEIKIEQIKAKKLCMEAVQS